LSDLKVVRNQQSGGLFCWNNTLFQGSPSQFKQLFGWGDFLIAVLWQILQWHGLDFPLITWQLQKQPRINPHLLFWVYIRKLNHAIRSNYKNRGYR
jgi:hypothetical protein